ncbi:unnamed protein product [Nippostrongylus brasiliensis]|uniref:Transposase n=1 Tax=Nippostrongylus brasiliensis TaxID=27835 RepID=A0A0N4XQN9_NIPBR|nr:unnamed protein product [Nippostrongylus brasiliensis]
MCLERREKGTRSLNSCTYKLSKSYSLHQTVCYVERIRLGILGGDINFTCLDSSQEAARKEVLDRFNKIRTRVAKGLAQSKNGAIPAAGNMYKLVGCTFFI